MKKKTLAMFLAYLLVAPAFGGETLRKYGVQTTVYFSLIDPAGIDLETAASCAT